MDEQEEKNQSESFLKQQTDKGKDIVKDQAKKQAKQKIVKFLIANPEVLAVIAIVIAVAILLVVFLGGALYIVDKWKENNVNGAKQGAITYAYSDNTTSGNSGTVVKIDETNAAEAPTRDEIENVITTRFKGEQQTNLMSVIDDLVKIQEDYKVNAIFAIAVMQCESSCGEALRQRRSKIQ